MADQNPDDDILDFSLDDNTEGDDTIEKLVQKAQENYGFSAPRDQPVSNEPVPVPDVIEDDPEALFDVPIPPPKFKTIRPITEGSTSKKTATRRTPTSVANRRSKISPAKLQGRRSKTTKTVPEAPIIVESEQQPGANDVDNLIRQAELRGGLGPAMPLPPPIEPATAGKLKLPKQRSKSIPRGRSKETTSKRAKSASPKPPKVNSSKILLATKLALPENKDVCVSKVYSINPWTGKPINTISKRGLGYLLKQACEDPQPTILTKEQCDTAQQNPTVNPITGGKLTAKSKIKKDIQYLCKQLHGTIIGTQPKKTKVVAPIVPEVVAPVEGPGPAPVPIPAVVKPEVIQPAETSSSSETSETEQIQKGPFGGEITLESSGCSTGKIKQGLKASYELKFYQSAVIEKLIKCLHKRKADPTYPFKGQLVALQTGTGKSLVALVAAFCLLIDGSIKGVDIVTTKKVQQQFQSKLIEYFEANFANKLKSKGNVSDLLRFHTYQSFAKDVKDFKEFIGRMIIFDEGQNIRNLEKVTKPKKPKKNQPIPNLNQPVVDLENQEAQQKESFMKLAKKAADYAEAVVVMTATPYTISFNNISTLINLFFHDQSGKYASFKDWLLAKNSELSIKNVDDGLRMVSKVISKAYDPFDNSWKAVIGATLGANGVEGFINNVLPIEAAGSKIYEGRKEDLDQDLEKAKLLPVLKRIPQMKDIVSYYEFPENSEANIPPDQRINATVRPKIVRSINAEQTGFGFDFSTRAGTNPYKPKETDTEIEKFIFNFDLKSPVYTECLKSILIDPNALAKEGIVKQTQTKWDDWRNIYRNLEKGVFKNRIKNIGLSVDVSEDQTLESISFLLPVRFHINVLEKNSKNQASSKAMRGEIPVPLISPKLGYSIGELAKRFIANFELFRNEWYSTRNLNNLSLKYVRTALYLFFNHEALFLQQRLVKFLELMLGAYISSTDSLKNVADIQTCKTEFLKHHRVGFLSGSTTDRQLGEILKNYAKGNSEYVSPMLVFSSAAAAGVDLQGTNYLFMQDLPFTYAEYRQIYGRGARFGSHRDFINKFFQFIEPILVRTYLADVTRNGKKQKVDLVVKNFEQFQMSNNDIYLPTSDAFLHVSIFARNIETYVLENMFAFWSQ